MDLHLVSYRELIDYAAGELDPGRAQDVAKHTAGCSECATTVARFRAVSSILKGDRSMAPPPAVLARALALVRHCPDELLVAFAAGELGKEASSVVAEHIASCPLCAEQVAHLRTLSAALRKDASIRIPEKTLTKAQALSSQVGTRTRNRLGLRRVLPPGHKRFAFVTGLAFVVLTFSLIFFASSAVAAESQNAFPGDVLYPVKRTFEAVRLATARDEATRIGLHLDFSRARLREANFLLRQKNQSDKVLELFQQYEHEIVELTTTSRETLPEPVKAQTKQVLVQSSAELNILKESAPDPTIKQHIVHAITLTEITATAVDNPTQVPPTPTWTGMPTTTPISIETAVVDIVAPSVTPSPTVSRTATRMVTPTRSRTTAPSRTLAPSPSITDVPTATEIAPTEIAPTETLPNWTETPRPPTRTEVASTDTPVPTQSPIPTEIREPTATVEPSSTATPLPTATARAVASPSETSTPEPTSTPVPDEATETATPTPESSTETPTPTEHSPSDDFNMPQVTQPAPTETPSDASSELATPVAPTVTETSATPEPTPTETSATPEPTPTDTLDDPSREGNTPQPTETTSPVSDSP